MRTYAKYIAVSFAATVVHTAVFAGMGRMPLEIKTLKVDSVSIGASVKVEFDAVIGFEVKNVTGMILPGEGFDIITQPDFRETVMRYGDTANFVGQIRPTKLGTWKVEFEARFASGDRLNCSDKRYFYIHLSDTLNRAYTAMEYFMLPKGREYLKSTKKPEHLIPLERFRPSKPTIPDTLTPKSHSNRQPAGSFEIIGCIVWHDPRDPSGPFAFEQKRTNSIAAICGRHHPDTGHFS